MLFNGLTVLFAGRFRSCPVAIGLAEAALQTHHMVAMGAGVGGARPKVPLKDGDLAQGWLGQFRTFSIYLPRSQRERDRVMEGRKALGAGKTEKD